MNKNAKRERSPERWLSDGPLEAGQTVEYRPPSRPGPPDGGNGQGNPPGGGNGQGNGPGGAPAQETVQATILEIDTEGPGTVMHAQYSTPTNENGNNPNG